MSVALVALATLLPAAGVTSDRTAYEMVATLWRGASIRKVERHGRTKRIIAPIRRKGEVGFIDRVERIHEKELGDILAFSIRLAKKPKNLEGWIAGRSSPKKIRLVTQLVLLSNNPSAKTKVSKPEGFPLERHVDTTCLGDVCAHGDLYRGLLPVDGYRGLVVLLVSKNGYEDRVGYVVEAFENGMRRKFEVRGPTRLASEIGCDASTDWNGLRWDKLNARLVAATTTKCTCGDECKEHGYNPGVVASDRVLGPKR